MKPSPKSSKAPLNDPELRSHSGSRLKGRRRFTGKHGHCRAQFHQNVSWAVRAIRRTQALVGRRGKNLFFSWSAGRRASDLALERFVERRRKQLKVERAAARHALTGQPLHDALSEFHQISRDHALMSFVPAPIAPVYLIRALATPAYLRGPR